MDPTGNFKPPATCLYIVAFSGTIAPASPTKKNVYATMVVGSDEVAYAYAAYDDHYDHYDHYACRWCERYPKGHRCISRTTNITLSDGIALSSALFSLLTE